MSSSPKTMCSRCGKPITKKDVWIMVDGKPHHFTCPDQRQTNPHNPNGFDHLTDEEIEALLRAMVKPAVIH